MTHQLRSRDIIALGFMTFALFVGAGNIIFPQWSACRQANTSGLRHSASLIAAVGLPVLTVVALAKLAAVLTVSARQLVKSLAYCWQQFVTRRWGRFSYAAYSYRFFEVGIAPLTGDSALPLFIYQPGLFRYRYSGFALSGQSCWIPWATSLRR